MRLPILICLLALGACSRPPRSTVPTDPGRVDEAATTTEKAPAPAEDRYRLEQEGRAEPVDVEFEEDRLRAPEDTGGEGFDVQAPKSEEQRPQPIPPSQTIPVEPTDPNAPASTRVVRGFRVQLAAFADAGEAESTRRVASSRLGVPVYVVFEAPLHKVRAGDYVDRADAVALQTRARSYGYSEAWVVSTEVRIPAP